MENRGPSKGSYKSIIYNDIIIKNTVSCQHCNLVYNSIATGQSISLSESIYHQAERQMGKPRLLKREAKIEQRISLNDHVIIRNFSKLPHLEGAIGTVVKEPTYPSSWYTVRFGDGSEENFRYPNFELMKGDVTRMQCKDCLKWSFITTASLGVSGAETARLFVIDRDDDSGEKAWTCKKANNYNPAIMLCKSISMPPEAKAIINSTVNKYQKLINFGGDSSTWKFDPHRREQQRSPPPTTAAATLIAPISNSDNSDSNSNR